jgi:predicted subunit of tRNA(5-methylaminomethyl-2-thiouridylate) methyltransferase
MTLLAQAHRLLDPSIAGLGSGTALNSVLMFSGGRDSAIAALRMHESGLSPVLVTISSWHLIGIDRVHQRVRELERYLPAGTPWLIVRQPTELKTDTSFYQQTCLPCHHAYVVVGAAVAAKAGIKQLAFGYARYQSEWPEQTPFAISHLTSVLARHGLQLILPVYDLASRRAAVEELEKSGLSVEALEQKCVQQVTNLALGDELLSQQVSLWERAIDISMSVLPTIEIEVIEATTVGSR